MTTIVVAAVAANGVIGAGGDLAWRRREDMVRLKAMTMGHTLVMGRKNFEAIGRALPGRRTVVLTRRADWHADGVTVVHDAGAGLDEALRAIVETSGDETVFIFGGGEIYRRLLHRADRLELTEIDDELDGDTYFPRIDRTEWREVSRERRDGFSWVRYDRAVETPPAAHKADFGAAYVSADPRVFFRALNPLGYQIPRHAVDTVRTVYPQLAGPGSTILDVCCSYGINAALLTCRMDLTEMADHHGDPARGAMDDAAVLAEDREFYAERRRPDAPTVFGLDASAPAIDYGVAAGLLERGWAQDLERDDPSPELVAGIGETDLVLCTGGIGYIGAPTFRRIAAAARAPERLVFLSFVLRMYDYDPIADGLAEFGLSTVHRSDISVRQRRFADEDERAAALQAVRAKGLDPAGREADGWYYADCFVTAANPPR